MAENSYPEYKSISKITRPDGSITYMILDSQIRKAIPGITIILDDRRFHIVDAMKSVRDRFTVISGTFLDEDESQKDSEPIIREKILNSSNIDKIRWDNNNLFIHFRNGTAYRYFDVPESISIGMSKSESPGSYFKAYIKSNYRYAKIEQ